MSLAALSVGGAVLGGGTVMNNKGLRTAVVVAGVASALVPVVAAFVQVRPIEWATTVIALVAFVFLIAPHMPIVLTARYEPVSRGKLIGLLVCELIFGVVPAAGLGLFVAGGRGGGLAFALLLFVGGTVLLVVQLVAFGVAVRIVRGPKPSTRVPAHWTWV
jgi:hypothetical protein